MIGLSDVEGDAWDALVTGNQACNFKLGMPETIAPVLHALSSADSTGMLIVHADSTCSHRLPLPKKQIG